MQVENVVNVVFSISMQTGGLTRLADIRAKSPLGKTFDAEVIAKTTH